MLGVGFGLAVTLGTVIGSGILRAPGQVARAVPQVWLFMAIWFVAGAYALLGAVSISELASMLPRSGGFYVYAFRAFGEYGGFAVGVWDWLAQCGSLAAVCIVVGEYTADLLGISAGSAVRIACLVIVVAAWFQWRGMRASSFVQNLTSSAKSLALLALVVALFILPHRPPAHVTLPPAHVQLHLAAALVLALQAAIFTFDGWYGVIYFGEEVRDPEKSIHRSMIWGILATTAIYLGLNAATLHVLPISQIANEDLALAAAARAVLPTGGDAVFRIIVVVSLLSGINANLLIASRIPFAMASDGLLPRGLERVNHNGTPTWSLLVSAVAAVIFIQLGSFSRVIGALSIFLVSDYAVAYSILFVLRKREPDLMRSYRAWGFPWTTGIALLSSIAFLLGAIANDPTSGVWALLVVVVTVPMFPVFRRRTPLEAGREPS